MKLDGHLQVLPRTHFLRAIVCLFSVGAEQLVGSSLASFCFNFGVCVVSLHLAESGPGQPSFSNGGHVIRPSHLSSERQLCGTPGLGLEPWTCLKCQSSANEKFIYIYLLFVNGSKRSSIREQF